MTESIHITRQGYSSYFSSDYTIEKAIFNFRQLDNFRA